MTCVDVLLVRTGTTRGLRRDDAELVGAISELGLTVAHASSDYGLLGRLRIAFPLIDLIEALSLRHAVARALRHTEARALIFSTATSAMLQPRTILARSAIRFDAPVASNRPGWRNFVTRWLGRRSLERAALLLPFSLDSDMPPAAQLQVLPSPIPPGPPPADIRERAALCYAGNPEKKGLDLAVEAWAQAAPPGWPLYVTGIDAEAGQLFLRRRGVRAGENIVWCGRIEPEAHRELSARVEVFLGAARSDEFAGAQLEALIDGAVLVTVPSAGPIIPLALARQLDSSLVATEISASALATCITRAFAQTSQERDDYRQRATELMTPYTRAAFRRALSEHVLPSLFALAEK